MHLFKVAIIQKQVERYSGQFWHYSFKKISFPLIAEMGIYYLQYETAGWGHLMERVWYHQYVMMPKYISPPQAGQVMLLQILTVSTLEAEGLDREELISAQPWWGGVSLAPPGSGDIFDSGWSCIFSDWASAQFGDPKFGDPPCCGDKK